MKAFAVAFFVLFFSEQLSAATITSAEVSATADANDYFTVTILGSGFGTGPTLFLFDDFNNQTLGANVALNKALVGTWSPTSSYSLAPTIVSNGTGKAIQVHDYPSQDTQSIRQIEVTFPNKVRDLFISYSVQVPAGRFFPGATTDLTFPNVSSWKFTWITDTPDGIASTTLFNTCAPNHSGSGSFLINGNSANLGYLGMADSWSWHEKNYMSLGLQPNPADPHMPGRIVFQQTGKKGTSFLENLTDTPVFPADNTTSFNIVKFPGWFGNGDFSNFDAYYDDIYVATGTNALARVELSDSQNITASVKNITLPPISWSDTKIEVKVHREHMGATQNKYIRYYNRDNQSTTFKLSCNLCPRPPVPL